jgi:uncharacterized membrane protein
LIRAQGSATYDAIVLSKFEFNVVADGRVLLAGPGDISYVTPSGGACGAIAVSNERISPAVWSSSGKLKRLKSGKLGGAAQWSDDNETVVGLQAEIDPAYNLPVTKPTVWRDGEPTILPGLDGQVTGYATAIGPDGVIFGYLAGQTGVRWVDDQPEALPLADGLSTFNPTSILTNGDVIGVGASSTAPCVGILAQGAVTFTELPADSYGVISVGWRYGMGGTSAGLIVGTTGSSGGFVSFKVEDGTFSFIDNPEGKELILLNMNESGLAAGTLREGQAAVAVTWQDGEITDLNTVSNTDGLPLRLATGINDDGVIACISDVDANQPTALLLVPVA